MHRSVSAYSRKGNPAVNRTLTGRPEANQTGTGADSSGTGGGTTNADVDNQVATTDGLLKERGDLRKAVADAKAARAALG